MDIIEKMARAIWSAQLDHFGKYRGNVDTPFEELSASRQLELRREAIAAYAVTDVTISEMVQEFHDTYDIPAPSTLSEIPPEREKMRLRIDMEEFLELVDACGMTLYAHGLPVELSDCAFVPNGKTPDPVAIADAIGDGIYVKYGHGIERGIPVDDVLREIHHSNMSKLDDDGNPIYRDDGKVLKGPNYSPPDIGKVIYGPVN